MGLRFQKRIRIFKGLTINLSKSGVSMTVGRPGASINIGKNGTTGNVGIPGTGISYREKLSGSEILRPVVTEQTDVRLQVDSGILQGNVERSTSIGKWLFIAAVVGLLIYILASYHNGKSSTAHPAIAANHPAIAACKDGIRDSVRRLRVIEPYSTVDPDAKILRTGQPLMSFSDGLFGDVKLRKNAQGYEYITYVNDNYGSSLSTYTCNTTDAGVVIDIAKTGP